MKKGKIIGYALLGGLLLKILHNQQIIDNHIEEASHGGYVYSGSTVEYNSLKSKIERTKLYQKLYNILN